MYIVFPMLGLLIAEFIVDIIWTRKYYDLKEKYEELKKNG